MKFYTELTLIPDADTPTHYLWKNVMQTIHIGIVETRLQTEKIPIGISFPHYNLKKFTIGNKMRLFAQTEDTLKTFDLNTRVDRLSDYVHVTSIKPVPDRIAGYSTFYKVHKKTYKDILVRRRSRRHNISIEQAYKDYENFVPQVVNLPYINMKSCSIGVKYRLYIEKKDMPEPCYEGFTTYGLSRISTVPIF